MIDFQIYKPFKIKKLSEGKLSDESGDTISPGDLYIENEFGEVFSFNTALPIDFFGDFILEEDDYKTVTGSDLDIQDIYIRLFTETTDFSVYPDMGANISDLKGMFNEPETAELGKQKIISALTRDFRFDESNFSIDVVPVSHDKLIYFIELYTSEGDIVMPIPFEL